MSDTNDLLKLAKADGTGVFDSGDLSGGKLNPEQADRFIEKLIDYAVITKDCRYVKMNAPQRVIEKVNFMNRILQKPQTQGTVPATSEIKVPTTEKITLTTNELLAAVDMGFDTLEDNIEHAGFEDHVIDLAAQRIALDLEEFYLLGDTTTSDSFLAIDNGWLKQATSHVYDHASATFSEDAVFGGMLDLLPIKYFRRPSDWRFYVNPLLERKVRRERAARQTGGGDTWLSAAVPVDYQGVPIVGVPLMPSTSSTLGNVLLVHPKNIVVGIQRNVTFDRFRNGRRRVIEMTWTVRVDTLYEEEDAVVKGKSIS